MRHHHHHYYGVALHHKDTIMFLCFRSSGANRHAFRTSYSTRYRKATKSTGRHIRAFPDRRGRQQQELTLTHAAAKTSLTSVDTIIVVDLFAGPTFDTILSLSFWGRPARLCYRADRTQRQKAWRKTSLDPTCARGYHYL